MKTLFPEKLKTGDEIRVVSPAVSLAVLTEDVRQRATQRLTDLGFQITFGEHASECDEFRSSSVDSRVADIHAAFADPNVKGILTTLGGYNSNQILRKLDFDLIRANPKVFCGYSDITALQNAILAKTGLVTYSGPHYSSFGMALGFGYTLAYFQSCVMMDEEFDIIPSSEWSDDAWYMDQEKRAFYPNPGWQVLTHGEAEGRLVGANLCTLNLLQGTEYMPDLDGAILFVEDDEESKAGTFDRDLQSVLHLPQAAGLRGLVVGRFQRASNMSAETVRTILSRKPELDHIPVIYQADFGHTTPFFTFPIGGKVRLFAGENGIQLRIEEH